MHFCAIFPWFYPYFFPISRQIFVVIWNNVNSEALEEEQRKKSYLLIAGLKYLEYGHK